MEFFGSSVKSEVPARWRAVFPSTLWVQARVRPFVLPDVPSAGDRNEGPPIRDRVLLRTLSGFGRDRHIFRL